MALNDIWRGTSLHVRRQISDLLDAISTLLTNMTAGKLAGRGTSSGSGAIEEITVGPGLIMVGTVLQTTGNAESVANQALSLAMHNAQSQTDILATQVFGA